MRHRKQRSKLSMMTAHRDAMVRNMVRNLLTYQRIQTTTARAKVCRRLAEHVISLGKKNTVFARRQAYAVLGSRDLVKKLFDEIAPLFKNRTSGFTRIIPAGFRRGDSADLAYFELTEMKSVEKVAKKKREAKKEDIPAEPKNDTASKNVVREEPAKDIKKEGAKAKSEPKGKPAVGDDKRSIKTRPEGKKIAENKNFMKNIRGLFRKKGDM